MRSYLTRKHCKQNEREEFDNIFPKVSADNADMLCLLVSKILFFYDDKEDSSRLVIFFDMNNFGICILVAIKIIVTNLIIAIWFIIIDCSLSFYFFSAGFSIPVVVKTMEKSISEWRLFCSNTKITCIALETAKRRI